VAVKFRRRCRVTEIFSKKNNQSSPVCKSSPEDTFMPGRLRVFAPGLRYFLENSDDPLTYHGTFQGRKAFFNGRPPFISIDRAGSPAENVFKRIPQFFKIDALITDQVGQPLKAIVVGFINPGPQRYGGTSMTKASTPVVHPL
jgi:hypothetical protein